MNNFRLTSFLTSNIDIDKNNLESLVSQCKTKIVKKGEYLLKEGEKCKYSFFVEHGLLRQYALDDKGKEHILQFAPENWIVTDRESVYFDQPSAYYIQALENTNTILFEESLILHLSKQDPLFLEFNNKLLHNHIRQLQRRITLLISATAEERYLDFVRLYPDLLLRVPQWQIASYLGITAESLSRVRKELTTKS